MARLQHHIIKKVRINQLNYECPSNNWHFVVPQLITMTGKRKLQKFKLPIGIFCGDHRSFKHTTEELWSVAIALPLHWMVQQKPFPFFFSKLFRSFLGVTVHFLDEESLERKCAALTCHWLSGRHTYDCDSFCAPCRVCGPQNIKRVSWSQTMVQTCEGFWVSNRLVPAFYPLRFGCTPSYNLNVTRITY